MNGNFFFECSIPTEPQILIRANMGGRHATTHTLLLDYYQDSLRVGSSDMLASLSGMSLDFSIVLQAVACYFLLITGHKQPSSRLMSMPALSRCFFLQSISPDNGQAVRRLARLVSNPKCTPGAETETDHKQFVPHVCVHLQI